jgi:hypothetical protein
MWRVYAVAGLSGVVGVNVSIMRSLDHVMTPGTIGPVTSPSCKETYISMPDPIAWLNAITIGALGPTLVAPPTGATETSEVATAVGPVVLPEQAMVPARIAPTKATTAVRIDMARFLPRWLAI